jgi:hypothetical protein
MQAGEAKPAQHNRKSGTNIYPKNLISSELILDS